jgi:RNA polymerase sigma-70 factor (ECF subfamily)
MGGPDGPPKQAQDERNLVERARGRDREAFGSLVRCYQGRAFNLAYQMLRNREEALDVAQEAFARAYASLPTFKGESSFSTWLHRIVVNLGIDALRRMRRGGIATYDDTRATPEEGEQELQAADDPAATLEMKQVRELLVRGMAKLPAAQRTVLVLREVEGLSYEEIARLVGCNLGTVMSRLFYARRRLRQVLEAHLADLR